VSEAISILDLIGRLRLDQVSIEHTEEWEYLSPPQQKIQHAHGLGWTLIIVWEGEQIAELCLKPIGTTQEHEMRQEQVQPQPKIELTAENEEIVLDSHKLILRINFDDSILLTQAHLTAGTIEQLRFVVLQEQLKTPSARVRIRILSLVSLLLKSKDGE
jgi:hypothetical protein